MDPYFRDPGQPLWAMEPMVRLFQLLSRNHTVKFTQDSPGLLLTWLLHRLG